MLSSGAVLLQMTFAIKRCQSAVESAFESCSPRFKVLEVADHVCHRGV